MNKEFRDGFEKRAFGIGPAAAKIEAFRAARKAAKGLAHSAEEGLAHKADEALNYKTLRKEFSAKAKTLHRAPKTTNGYSAYADQATSGMNSGTNYRKAGISTNVDPKTRLTNTKTRPLF